MKKKMVLLLVVTVLCFSLLMGTTAFAHELWIDVEEVPEGGELKVDVLWGHIRDFLDQANYEDYQLYVRTPGGQVNQLELERIGVQGRAYIDAAQQGQYVFWAIREPGTYTPGGGVTTLSVQKAKTIYQHGQGAGTAGEPVEMLLEIVPETDLTAFTGNEFKGTALFEGNPAPSAVISAYGPSGEVLETETSSEGQFEFNLQSSGIWLVKANISSVEEGNLDGQEYGMVSRTTTLVFDTGAKTAPSQAGSVQASTPTPILGMVLPLIIGLLIGGAGTLLLIGNKRK